MITVRDVESAVMEAQALVDEAFAGVEDEFNGPDADLMLYMMYQRMPPEVLANLKAMDPASFQQLQDKIDEIEKRKERRVM